VTARESILEAIRGAAVPSAPLADVPVFAAPALAAAGPVPGGAAVGAGQVTALVDQGTLVRRFAETLGQVGGSAREVAGLEGLAAAVREETGPFRHVVCCVRGVGASTLEVGPDTPAATLAEVEVAVVRGRLGVAENAAVWVDEADLPHRAVHVVAEHLVLVLSKDRIVADLHEAYRLLARPLPGYGLFISGPSKTADIEQALVIGAQGPRSLVVLLV